jgi:hypothetical protein
VGRREEGTKGRRGTAMKEEGKKERREEERRGDNKRAGRQRMPAPCTCGPGEEREFLDVIYGKRQKKNRMPLPTQDAR